MSNLERSVVRITAKNRQVQNDYLPAEEPVEFRLGRIAIAVLMRTPGHDDELARGFALSEGIIIRPDELETVEELPGEDGAGRYELILSAGVVVDPERFRRNLYATSSCGVCGKASIDAVRVAARRPPDGPTVDPAALLAMMEQMRSRQEGFDKSGGLHAAAAFDPDGGLLAIREDIGRHNAMDKLIGFLANRSWPISECVVTVSGRVSFELVQKAAVAGLSLIAGVSAASSLAADLGNELGVTVAGFVRGPEFNVYSHPDRIG